MSECATFSNITARRLQSVFAAEQRVSMGSVEIKSSPAPGFPKQPHTSALIKSLGGDQEEETTVFICVGRHCSDDDDDCDWPKLP